MLEVQLAISTTDFICALVITNSCLKYLQALTSNLQAESKDIVAAVKEIDNVTGTLQKVGDNIETHHSQWFSTVEEMCTVVGTEPSLPRRCGKQIYRANVPADSPLEYFCRSISIPLLDHLLSEMNSRFSKHQQTALLGLCLTPSIMVTLPAVECTAKVDKLADMKEDLPSPDCVHSELECWQLKWHKQLQEHGEKSLPTSHTQTIRLTSTMYPNIKALISILCTPSCSAERSFSGLKRIKTAFRSSMTNHRLSRLTLLHVHR